MDRGSASMRSIARSARADYGRLLIVAMFNAGLASEVDDRGYIYNLNPPARA